MCASSSFFQTEKKRYGFGEDKRRALRCEWFTKVKNYQSSMGLPGANGVARRRFLVGHAMGKCRKDPQLHARMLSSETDVVTPLAPNVQKYLQAKIGELTVVPESSATCPQNQPDTPKTFV
jgi:hypothetical protein